MDGQTSQWVSKLLKIVFRPILLWMVHQLSRLPPSLKTKKKERILDRPILYSTQEPCTPKLITKPSRMALSNPHSPPSRLSRRLSRHHGFRPHRRTSRRLPSFIRRHRILQLQARGRRHQGASEAIRHRADYSRRARLGEFPSSFSLLPLFNCHIGGLISSKGRSNRLPRRSLVPRPCHPHLQRLHTVPCPKYNIHTARGNGRQTTKFHLPASTRLGRNRGTHQDESANQAVPERFVWG